MNFGGKRGQGREKPAIRGNAPGKLPGHPRSPGASGRRNRRRRAAHASAAGAAACLFLCEAGRETGKPVGGRRPRQWRDRRLADSAGAGTAPGRGCSRSRSGRLAVGAHAGTTGHRALHRRPRLGLRNPLAFHPGPRSGREARNLCPRRRPPSLVCGPGGADARSLRTPRWPMGPAPDRHRRGHRFSLAVQRRSIQAWRPLVAHQGQAIPATRGPRAAPRDANEGGNFTPGELCWTPRRTWSPRSSMACCARIRGRCSSTRMRKLASRLDCGIFAAAAEMARGAG